MANVNSAEAKYEMIRQLYVNTANESVVLKAYQKGMITANDYERILGKVVPEKTLSGAKDAKLAQTTADLAAFLEANPLISSCHGGEAAAYTVTEDKQNMFSRKFSAHMALVQAGVPDVMTWNAAGQPCEEWTDAEAIQFIAESNAYITPLVSKQQHLEVEINACETVEAVEAIVIDYASVVAAMQ